MITAYSLSTNDSIYALVAAANWLREQTEDLAEGVDPRFYCTHSDNGVHLDARPDFAGRYDVVEEADCEFEDRLIARLDAERAVSGGPATWHAAEALLIENGNPWHDEMGPAITDLPTDHPHEALDYDRGQAKISPRRAALEADPRPRTVMHVERPTTVLFWDNHQWAEIHGTAVVEIVPTRRAVRTWKKAAGRPHQARHSA